LQRHTKLMLQLASTSTHTLSLNYDPSLLAIEFVELKRFKPYAEQLLRGSKTQSKFLNCALP
jgi:hypothetical protein